MGHPMTVHLPHSLNDVLVRRVDPRCDWRDCLNHVRWEVAPMRYLPALNLPGDYFCTAHARAIIKQIESHILIETQAPPGSEPDA